VPDGIDPAAHMGMCDYHELPVAPSAGKSFLRHLRLTNEKFLRSSVPEYLADTQATVAKLVDRWGIEVVVCMVPPAAEILEPVHLPKLLDYCDSRTLTFRRMLRNRGGDMSIRERITIYLKYFRQRQLERALVRRFDRTTTISNADRDCLLEVAGVQPGKVLVVPNGVSAEALQCDSLNANRKRSVVFWGNLDFPPNWTAVDYFNRRVFLPYLADKDIEWHIIGKGANDKIRELAQHPMVHLHGFVEDLYAEISTHGVMINPMVEGSGLKNKVLEAFACHLPVVTTTIGFQATGAQAGEHYLLADDPSGFADAVVRCLDDDQLRTSMTNAGRKFVEDHFEWNAIGDQLDGIIQEIAP
jgi:glycosyltransferase involved in cell wall biosynthesis